MTRIGPVMILTSHSHIFSPALGAETYCEDELCAIRISPSHRKHTNAEDQNRDHGNCHQPKEELLLAGDAHTEGGQRDPYAVQSVQDAGCHDQPLTKNKKRRVCQDQELIVALWSFGKQTQHDQVQIKVKRQPQRSDALQDVCPAAALPPDGVEPGPEFDRRGMISLL